MLNNEFRYQRTADAFCQHAFGKKIELLADLPRVLVSRAAYNRMWHFVDLADKEVGWLGTCDKVGRDFLIENVFLFKQEVSATTTEITGDGLAEFAMGILSSRRDGMEVINALRFWGHSHVRMGTSHSGQDESQMSTFQESGHDFFIRGIFNKNGRMEFTIFMYSLGLKIVDPEWSIYEPVDNSLRAEIEAEFAAKVSEKVYAPAYQNIGGTHYPFEVSPNRTATQVSTAGKSGSGKKGKNRKGAVKYVR